MWTHVGGSGCYGVYSSNTTCINCIISSKCGQTNDIDMGAPKQS